MMNIKKVGSGLAAGVGTMLTIAATLALFPFAAQAQHAGGGGGRSHGGGGGGFHGGGSFHGGGGGGGFHGGGGGGHAGGGGFHGGYGGGGWDRGYYGAPALVLGTPYGYCTPPLAYGRDDYYGYRHRQCE